ncbi:MAG: Trans-hexaprenyltranstransferase [Pseudonocardiales bacterium]|nr:Trans-hexaprenyltranstransferase [Jatrophihabitantaceae bacterium]MCW2603321.1 Trans-hexaprenyltranstransferase [Pseudonocardiales bacterium]
MIAPLVVVRFGTAARHEHTSMSPAGAGTLGILFDDPQLEASVRSRLDDVEAALSAAVQSDDDFVSSVARHLVDAGGKRFRPLIAVLSAHFGDATGDGVVLSAVVMELTHLATLYHDDVMDEALLRRGAESANSRWGNTVAILTGDFLFSRASNILADLGPDAVRIQARTFERLVVGQIRETVGPGPGVDPVQHHLAVLADKTGSLIAASAELGGLYGGVGGDIVDALRVYGEQIGVAFQISDDILDLTSEAGQSGKTPGTDLREGIATLPALVELAGADPAQARLRELLTRPLPDDIEHAEALAALRASDGLHQARLALARYAEAARESLRAVPDVPARAALHALCDFVTVRTG